MAYEPYEPDGPCGCVGMHPGQSHEQHMDEVDRMLNRRLLDAALSDDPGACREELGIWRKCLCLHAFADAELSRLAAKKRWLTA